MNPKVAAQRRALGQRHLHTCIKFYRRQIAHSRYFLHEHPAGATSWRTPQVQEILHLPNVRRITSDMCAFGMTQYDGQGPGLIKKPTGFMSNSPEILKQLSRRCDGMHRHILLMNGRAKRAQVYPDELCKQILIGLVNQTRADGRLSLIHISEPTRPY